jgi:hypothetical protein
MANLVTNLVGNLVGNQAASLKIFPNIEIYTPLHPPLSPSQAPSFPFSFSFLKHSKLYFFFIDICVSLCMCERYCVDFFMVTSFLVVGGTMRESANSREQFGAV